MLNREKWAKEISEIKKDFDFKAVDRFTNRLIDCKVIDCDRCGLRHINEKNCRVAFEKWLDEETGVDWETLPIDTKIIVRYPNSKMDIKAYYAGMRYGKPTAWANGKTSWTADGAVEYWDSYRLAEEN